MQTVVQEYSCCSLPSNLDPDSRTRLLNCHAPDAAAACRRSCCVPGRVLRRRCAQGGWAEARQSLSAPACPAAVAQGQKPGWGGERRVGGLGQGRALVSCQWWTLPTHCPRPTHQPPLASELAAAHKRKHSECCCSMQCHSTDDYLPSAGFICCCGGKDEGLENNATLQLLSQPNIRPGNRAKLQKDVTMLLQTARWSQLLHRVQQHGQIFLKPWPDARLSLCWAGSAMQSMQKTPEPSYGYSFTEGNNSSPKH